MRKDIFESLKRSGYTELARAYYATAQENQPSLDDAISALFLTNANPKDADVHALAMKYNMSAEQLEERLYAMLSAYIHGVGKHNDVPDSQFDATELEIGVNVEMEHTDNKYIALCIAKDHLSECKKYYSYLTKMEELCKK